jgi:hypothetical protein
MLRVLLSIIVLGGLGAVAGCGNDDNEDATPATTAAKPAPAAKPAATTFLLARGEQPGFEPQGPLDEQRTVEEFNATVHGTAQDAARLRQRGFVSFTAQPLTGKDGGAGITNVAVFSNAAGARADWAEQRRDLEKDFSGWQVKRFGVPGVADAFGWTATRSSDRVGNVVWIEGRCVLTLGNAQAASFVGPLRTAVRAIHRRVAGGCP